MLEHPTFVQLEYWDPAKEEWTIGHAGLNLLHPRRYVERLAAKGKIGRVTDKETGEVFQLADPQPQPKDLCEWCDDFHAAPFDGTCML